MASGERPRVVIAHDFAETYGGAERILEIAAAACPEAHVWVIAGRRAVAERMGIGDRFHALLPENELLLRHYRTLVPIYPAIVTLRRLPAVDVLLTFSYAFAHGFRTENDSPQVCYCHSPLRFAWTMTDEYAESYRHVLPARVFRGFAAAMRVADRRVAGRADRYVANSQRVADQVRQAYRREAEVLNPPVDCALFRPSVEPGHDGFYLFCGRLIEPYKQPGIVIDAFRALPGRRLVVAGDGPAYRDLKERAGPNVAFAGHLDDEHLVPLMQRCAATIFPSEDDFGMIPLETMACGRPILAFAGGGALETVVAGRTGESSRRRPRSACGRQWRSSIRTPMTRQRSASTRSGGMWIVSRRLCCA